jgi:signal transduction histidine kinase
VKAPALGEAATHLPRLVPCANSLAALARLPLAAAWEQIRLDPACVVLIVREAPSLLTTAANAFFPTLIRHPAVLEGAVHYLDPAGHVDWNLPAVAPIYQSCVRYARLAGHFAEKSGCCDPDNAWVAGLLAPLGWLAVCSVDPSAAVACREAPDFASAASAVQRRLWGFDQAGIARRLARRWRLPPWLAAVVGYLGLPLDTAQNLGAEPNLFRIVQLAVALAERRCPLLRLDVHADPKVLAASFALSPDDVAEGVDAIGRQPEPSRQWLPTDRFPLLRDLLVVSAENRRLTDGPELERLESDLDHLQQALHSQQGSEAARLRAQKLEALAEFAAGAGHEINNPLAVISGQAQYLLGHEAEPARQQALQRIIDQAQRIHEILSELMQFARPPRPQKQPVDLAGLLRDVSLSLGELANHRRVQLICPDPEQPITLVADPRQVRTALVCLLRNAIEAAPAEGWAAVRLDLSAPGRLNLVVEDSGSGPTPAQREHLFDPFYSGRQAGRRRGLGLPTAWRLAREHGGDVYFDDSSPGPTRFVLTLPWQVSGNGSVSAGMTG